MPPQATNGWYPITVPVGALLTVALVLGLLRAGARAWFDED
jgi:hypothetical protein